MNLQGKGDTARPYSTTILNLAELLEWKTLWGMNAARTGQMGNKW